MQAHLDRIPILKRDGSARPRVVRCLQLLLVALAEAQQNRLDVFAGSQRIDREVRAGTVVLKETKPPNRHAIGTPAHRLADVIAMWSVGWPREDFERCCCGSVPPLGNLQVR